MTHLLCYSPSWTDHIGTTMHCEKKDIFSYLSGFFKTNITRVVIVETGEEIFNSVKEWNQLELLL